VADIFISYSSNDREMALQLAGALETEGWRVWWDRTMLPGTEFDETIEQELEAARIAIVLWSESAVSSRWVNAEAREALDAGKLVPVFLSNVKVRLVFRSVQGADFSTWNGRPDDKSFRQLVDALSVKLGPPPGKSEGTPVARGCEPKEEDDSERTQVGEKVAELHRRLLDSASLSDLQSVLYGVDYVLEQHAQHPDARALRERVRNAIRAEEKRLGPRAASRGIPIFKWAAALGVVTIAAVMVVPQLRERFASVVPAVGIASVTVPNIIGLDLEDARSNLLRAGLVIGTVKREASDAVNEGRVIAQMPQAGARVEKEAGLSLVVSSGPPRATVPRLEDLNLSEAQAKLAAVGLKLGKVSEYFRKGMMAGAVISQDPAEGQEARIDSRVHLLVAASGVEVPNVVGETEEQASKLLARAGLRAVAKAISGQDGNLASGRVARQSPAAGEEVALDTVVTLYLNDGLRGDAETIRKAQLALAELGYQPGPADGWLGEQTRQAIKTFQSETGLGVDGNAGPELITSLERAKRGPRRVLRDKLENGFPGPQMVVIPAGEFMMGSSKDDWGPIGDEGPKHKVRMDRAFAIGKYEVMYEEYDQCVAAGACREIGDQEWGRGKRPVVNVTKMDTDNFVTWLSEQTGKRYRLPTEAEWEYAARAGTDSDYWWGKYNEVGTNWANCLSCGSEWDGKKTAPAGSFPPNPWGLHDTAGNVWEWTCSAYVDPYAGAEKTCTREKTAGVLRGGAWFSEPHELRSANRFYTDRTGKPYTQTLKGVGFRVVREL
jgi:formylglycine-generating enzyme required for sulfatase activity